MRDSLAGRGAQTNSDAIAGVVLAAGEGRRLRPLTLRRPKALCPVGAVPLVDRAVGHVRAATPRVAVNVHHRRDLLVPHLEGLGVHISVEERPAMGTAGALGLLRSWIDHRAVLAVNADAWSRPDLAAFVDQWDGERTRLLVAGNGGFSAGALVAASLVPPAVARELRPEPGHLYEQCWLPAEATGRLEVVRYDGPFVDCGTPRTYLQANLLAAAGTASGTIVADGAQVSGHLDRSVVGAGARVDGSVAESVVWDGAHVGPGEVLWRAIRADAHLTVLVR
jgi:N-acetyl-alpha-D-muramate 1-phosphate uridylyltransferase